MGLNKRGLCFVHGVRVTMETLGKILAYEEETEDVVTIKRTRYRRSTIRGIPARYVDLVVEDDVVHGQPGWYEVKLFEKSGRYDGAIRYRIQIRRDRSDEEIRYGDIHFDRNEETRILEIVLRDGVVAGCGIQVPILRSNLSSYRLGCVWMWHFRRYYSHLSSEIDNAVELADLWAASHENDVICWTLAEANRSASRDLYRISREFGWRKLTAREKTKYGFDSMWVRVADVEARASATGCGQHTLESARSAF